MRAINFNDGWYIRNGVADPFSAIFGQQEEQKAVILPHDAMIEEEREQGCASKSQSGFYPAKSYTYTKEFFVPDEWRERQQLMEFEGVMSKAFVYLNGEFVASNKYGYSGFTIDLSPRLVYGEKNTLKVIAVNQDQASRWYPGSGIYRDAVLWQGGQTYIVPGKVRITTEYMEPEYAVLKIECTIKNTQAFPVRLRLCGEVLEADGGVIAKVESFVALGAQEEAVTQMRVTVSGAKAWDVENPILYQCRLALYDKEELSDEALEEFGIRTLQLDARNGLRINGKKVKLRGACIHHDNGIIGAATLYQAEEFRMMQLKKAGFNSIRSAHHPAGKALLRACDRHGILVMDELSDMWNEPKNCNDYAIDFSNDWEQEVKRMVAKDYNHPCVVLYSTGNEIPEIGRASGAEMNRKIAACLRKEDPTRYVNSSISGFLAVTHRMQEFAAAMQEYSQANEQMEQAPESAGGSESLNNAMGAAGEQMLDAFSVSPILTECIEPVASEVDVVGYNYLTARHVLEHELHPDRIVVGSESSPPEIPRLWKIVEENPHVIGDFTWTGYDYLGEAGIGIYHYDTDRTEQGWYPDRLAYVGDIDLNANRRTISYLREIAYGLRKEPYLAVERVDKYGKKCAMNNWKYKDTIHSWTFHGYENRETQVHILSGCDEVELFLNGESLGRKKVGEQEPYTVSYRLNYLPGELIAVGYVEGKEAGRDVLRTAMAASKFQILVHNQRLKAGGQEIAFLIVDLTDKEGIWNRFEEKEVTVSLEGAGILCGFGSANPSCEGSYQNQTAATYDGRIMAAVRSGMEAGKIMVTFTAGDCEPQQVELTVV